MKSIFLLFLFSSLFSDAINVKTFFPSKELEQKKFIYKTHGMPMSQCIETFKIQNSCVAYHREYGSLTYIGEPIKINEKTDSKNNKKNVINNAFIDYTVCWNQDLIYPGNNTNSPFLTQKDKWSMELTVNEGKGAIKTLIISCQVVQQGTKNIFGKNRKIIKSECSGPLKNYTVFAEGLGIIESGTKYNSVKLVDINSTQN
jgi:hypothetical protein